MDSSVFVVLVVAGVAGVLTLWLGAAWLSHRPIPRQARHAKVNRTRREPGRYGEQPLPVLQDVLTSVTAAAAATPKAVAKELIDRVSAPMPLDGTAYASTLPMERSESAFEGGFAATDFRHTDHAATDWPATEPTAAQEHGGDFAPTLPMRLTPR